MIFYSSLYSIKASQDVVARLHLNSVKVADASQLLMKYKYTIIGCNDAGSLGSAKLPPSLFCPILDKRFAVLVGKAGLMK